jgi:SAM-dependent methyltransferase
MVFDTLVHPDATAAVLHCLRSGGESVIALCSKLRRKKMVIAQYDTDMLVCGYAGAHDLSRPEGRHLRSRVQLVQELLASAPTGKLLDAGCGPGVLVRALLDSPRLDYDITVLDQSPAMVKYCVASAREAGEVHATVGELETLPFADGTFDVTLTTGALEYTDAQAAIRQLSRVTRPGGVVLVSMLNPANLYRLTEWFLYWPALRLFCAVQKVLHIRTKRPHGANRSGIRALNATRLRRYMRRADLVPLDVVYFDLTPLVPPLDRIPPLRRWSEHHSLRSAPTRGRRRWMARGYILIAKRS